MSERSSFRKRRSVRGSRALFGTVAQAVTRYCAEALERRVMLSVSAPGIPNWVAEGPGPITQAQVVGMAAQGSPAVGATEVVLADPLNSSIVYAGTINGGVWKTTNANVPNDGIDNDLNGIIDDESPTWIPLTDHQTSLSIGSLVFDPGDPTHNTLWAGRGHYSSLNSDAAPLDGLLKTTDGGQTWTRLGASTLGGVDVQKILPLSVNDPVTGKQVVFIASTDVAGVMRSVDGGNTFASIGGGVSVLPGGTATDLAQDPTNPQRIYAAIPGVGVFRTNDDAANHVAATWVDMNLPNGTLTSQRILLSTHYNAGAGTFALYAGALTNNASGGVSLSAVYRYTPAGGWVRVLNMPTVTDIIPIADPGSYNHVALVADNIDANYFYVSGNRAPGQTYGAAYRGDAMRNTWTSFYNGSANSTAPHADSRSLAVDASGNVLQANDGGVYKLVNPFSVSAHWVSMNGNLSPTEVTTSALDLLNDRVFASEWDNGASEQLASGGLSWLFREAGDGQAVTVDNNDPSLSIRYFHASGGFGSMHRREYSPLNVAAAGDVIPQFASAPGQPALSGLNTADQTSGVGTIYTNRVAARRLLLVGSTGFYESSTKGDTITQLTIPGRAGLGIVLSVVYGIASNPDLIYIQFNGGLVMRQTAGGAFTTQTLYPNPHLISFPNFPGTRRIVVDPGNALSIYAIDSGFRGNAITRVWRSDTGGTPGSWVNITGDLLGYQGSNTGLYDVALVRTGAATTLLVAGQGGVYRLISASSAGVGAHWVEYGGNLPNVTLTDIHYYTTRLTANGVRGDVLVVGTLGRGVWELNSVSTTVATAGNITLTGTGLDDVYRIYRDGTQIKLDETLGILPTTHYAFEYDAVSSILVSTLAGNDSLTVDFSGGNPVPPGGISYDGGTDTAGDGFTILGSAGDDVIHEANATFSVNGSANIVALNVERDVIGAGDGNDTVDLDNVNVPTNVLGQNGNDTVNVAQISGNLDFFASIVVTGGAGNDQVILWDMNAPNSDGWTLNAGLISRGIFAGLDYGVGLTVENVIVHGGPHFDDYQINGSLTGTALSIIGGPGGDLFRFSPVAHDINSGFGGAINIDGGAGGNDQVVFRDDAASLDSNWTVTSTTVDKANAVPVAPLLTYSNLEGITIDGGNSGTVYTVQSTNTPVTLNTGGGDDRVEIGVYGAGNLDLISAPITVDGGIGGNTLYVEDSANTSSNNWGIGLNTIIRGFFGGVSFLNFANVVIDAYGSGGSGSLYNIFGIGFATTQIFAGPGADVFNIGDAPSGIAPLTIDGGAGVDTLNLLDQFDTNNTSYTISPGQVTRGGNTPITYVAVEAVVVQAGSGDNAFAVNGTVAATSVTLSGGTGNDTFSIAPAGSTLSSISGDLTIDGTTGANDQMFLSDQLNTGLLGNTIYNITPNSVQATFSAVIHFTNLDGLTLNASDGVSSLNLTGTALGTPVTINGGNGADQLTVAGAGLLADVTYDGGEPSVAPGDSLVVNGGGLSGMYLPSATSAGDGIVSVGARLINFRKLEPVTVTDFSSFTLQTQNSSDDISISSGFGNTATGTSGGVAMESLTWARVTNFILDLATHDGAGGGSMNDVAIIQAPGLFVPEGGTFLFKGGGGNDKLVVSAGSYTFAQDASLYTANLTVFGDAGSSLYFNSDQHLAGLMLNGGAAKLSATRHSMYVGALIISPTGFLDIVNTFLYLDNTVTSFATAKAYLDAAYNLHGAANPNAPVAGDYNGTGGITSSVAQASYATDLVVGIGYYDGALQDPANPDGIGQILGPDSNSGHGTGIALNQILIRPTLTGDLNGDGVVNSYDVTLFNSYGLFNTGPTPLGWQAGDLNGDGLVNVRDVTIFNTVGNFNTGSYPVPPALPSLAKLSTKPAVVPSRKKVSPKTRKLLKHSVRNMVHATVGHSGETVKPDFVQQGRFLRLD